MKIENLIFYQIYPRSFYDANGDGIGDIQGIISKMDYLKTLGINAVWLSPCFPSPNKDNGYDISDYRAISPELGTMKDFEKMLDCFHKKGIKLILDFVANHTSAEHEWFKQARKSKSNPYRDYYIWRKTPPNAWQSIFGGSAWEYDKKTDEYYLHSFAKEQADLNWDNPKVRAEMKAIIDFWVKKGVDGFRCDVLDMIAKDFKRKQNGNGARFPPARCSRWEDHSFRAWQGGCRPRQDPILPREYGRFPRHSGAKSRKARRFFVRPHESGTT